MSRETGEASVEDSLELLPWQVAARERLETALAGGRLPHALLLHGPEGVGKERFAAVIASGLLCRQRAPHSILPCGHCSECSLSRAGSHPDLYWLRRPDERKSIGIDAVRETCEQLAMTSLRGGHRVAVLLPAQAMTVSAQNALLKTLEEPAPRTLLVLVTSRPSGLLPTLRSRCQRIEIPRPDVQAAEGWLAGELGRNPAPGLLDLAGGAPLKALALAPHFAALSEQMTELLRQLLDGHAEVTGTAAEMLGDGLAVRLDWMEAWIGGLLRSHAGADANELTFPGASLLQRRAAEVNISAAFRMVDRLREARRLLEGSAAAQLVVEALLVDLVAAFGRRGVA